MILQVHIIIEQPHTIIGSSDSVVSYNYTVLVLVLVLSRVGWSFAVLEFWNYFSDDQILKLSAFFLEYIHVHVYVHLHVYLIVVPWWIYLFYCITKIRLRVELITAPSYQFCQLLYWRVLKYSLLGAGCNE